jgi:polynucleotide 5'-kinase involved in rRNA processing
MLAPVKQGTVLLIGCPGTGKSQLARYLTHRLAQEGRTVGLLSADMGQATLGVPACLGLALLPPWDQPDGLWFVGDTTPVGNLLPAVVGAVRLAERARQAGAQAVVVDTTGLAQGSVGHVLKYHKVAALAPEHVVALQQADELEPLLTLLAGLCPSLYRLRPAAEAHDRSASERKQYREDRFRRHFQGAEVIPFPPDRLVNRDWSVGGLAAGQLPVPGTLVGLLDSHGFCLGLGLLEEAGPSRLGVYTSWRRPEAVARLQLGRLRLTRQGEELS